MIDFRKEPRPMRRPPVPFPSLHPAERIRGSGILDEHEGMVGQLLWESYRNVGDWAIRPRKKRFASMFEAAAVERRNRQLAAEWMEPELRAPLEVIRDMMAEPRRTDARVVARACRRLSAWAGERGAPMTQFYFAAAAGLCVTEDAQQAYHAGCLARDLARWDAAEVWLEHAMETARRRREREAQVMAVLGMGNMYYRQGLYQKARDAYGAGLLLARKHGLAEIEGRSLHDLFVVAVEMGEYARAEALAQHAVKAYGPAHHGLPGLAHDVAYFWLTQRDAARALPVLTALLPHLRQPAHRLHALASTCRAAGLCGEREVFERARLEIWALREQPELRSRLAPALLELALGAAALGEWVQAENAASSALHLAEQRGEIDVIGRAGALLEALGRGAVPEECVPAASAGSADELVHDLVNALTAGANASG